MRLGWRCRRNYSHPILISRGLFAETSNILYYQGTAFLMETVLMVGLSVKANLCCCAMDGNEASRRTPNLNAGRDHGVVGNGMSRTGWTVWVGSGRDWTGPEVVYAQWSLVINDHAPQFLASTSVPDRTSYSIQTISVRYADTCTNVHTSAV